MSRLGEFSLIETFFRDATQAALDSGTIMAIGDDAAVLQPPANKQLVVTTDTLVSGVHFFPDMPPHALGHKSLAVNLSDLAAMGAQPKWLSLAITLPTIDEAWLNGFTQGFTVLALQHQCALIGGDTTQGPLSITITAHGLINTHQANYRHRAQAGDLLYVTGPLGEPAYYLEQLYAGKTVPAHNRLYYPTPRCHFMSAANQFINAAIDVSDGLLAEVGHVIKASQVGATLNLDALWSLSKTAIPKLHPAHLSQGDEYEICFCAPREHTTQLQQLAIEHDIQLINIGEVTSSQQVKVSLNNQPYNPESQTGYQHFSS